MDCLYKTTTTNTFDEYKKFNKAIMRRKSAIVAIIISEICLIVSGIGLKNIFLIVFGILWPLVTFFLQKIQIKRVFESNKVLQNAVAQFEFYDTYFTETNEYDNTKLEYTKLYKIIETKTNFYLMISKNQGFILCKANFPEGLDEFLRNIKIS